MSAKREGQFPPFCTVCGAANPNDERFCTQCGVARAPRTLPDEVTAAQSLFVPNLARPRASRRSRPILLLAVIVLLVGGGVAGYQLLSRHDQANQAASPTSPSSAAPGSSAVTPTTANPTATVSQTGSIAPTVAPSAAETPSETQGAPTQAPEDAIAAGPTDEGRSGRQLGCMQDVDDPPQDAGAAMCMYNQAINNKERSLICAMNRTASCGSIWSGVKYSTWSDIEILDVAKRGPGKWAVHYTGRTRQPGDKGYDGQTCSDYDLVYYLRENESNAAPYVIEGHEPGRHPSAC